MIGDGTPVHRRPTEELPALALLSHRIHEVEKRMDQSAERDQEIIAGQQEIITRLAVGTERFTNTDKRLTSLEGDRRWIVMATIGAVASLAWHAVTTFFKPHAILIACSLPFVTGCRYRAGYVSPPTTASAALDVTVGWTVAIGILGLGASVAALIWLPVLKRTALACAAGFAAVIGCALMVQAVQPYLPWVGLGLILTAAVVGILELRKHVVCPVPKVAP